jgi:hypothetical protein
LRIQVPAIGLPVVFSPFYEAVFPPSTLDVLPPSKSNRSVPPFYEWRVSQYVMLLDSYFPFDVARRQPVFHYQRTRISRSGSFHRLLALWHDPSSSTSRLRFRGGSGQFPQAMVASNRLRTRHLSHDTLIGFCIFTVFPKSSFACEGIALFGTNPRRRSEWCYVDFRRQNTLAVL